MSDARAHAVFTAELTEQLGKQLAAHGVDVPAVMLAHVVEHTTSNWDVVHESSLFRDANGRVQDKEDLAGDPGPWDQRRDLTRFRVFTPLREV